MSVSVLALIYLQGQSHEGLKQLFTKSENSIKISKANYKTRNVDERLEKPMTKPNIRYRSEGQLMKKTKMSMKV